MIRSRFFFPPLLFASLALSGCITADPPVVKTAYTEAGAAHFHDTVKPLFEHRCSWCHNAEKPHGGLNFENRAIVLSQTARFIVPGKPEQSRIYVAVNRDPDHMKIMPYDGWVLSERQKQAIHDWIASGAYWPAGERGALRRKDYRVDLDDYL